MQGFHLPRLRAPLVFRLPRANQLVLRFLQLAHCRAEHLSPAVERPIEFPRRLVEGPINNAVLLSFSVYHSPGRMQQELLDSVGGELRLFIDLYKKAQERADGPAWLRRLAAEYQATLPISDSEPADSHG